MTSYSELYCSALTFFFGAIFLKLLLFFNSEEKRLDEFVLFDIYFVYLGLALLFSILLIRALLWIMYNWIDGCMFNRRIKKTQRLAEILAEASKV